jgi:chromosome segregation ATPase
MNLLTLVTGKPEFLTTRRMVLAGLAAAGIYTAGDDGLSYLKTANRLVSTSVADQIPVEFELERAKTMVSELKPDIKNNMLVIAQEEVRVDNIRQEIEKGRESLRKQRSSIVELRKAQNENRGDVRVGKRSATSEEIESELKRRFDNYRLAEATLESKLELLNRREATLEAAREKLQRTLEARRDLEVKVDNLEARLRTAQSESISNRVDFDESHVARCESILDSLRSRLQVTEKMMLQDGGKSNVSLPTKMSVGNGTVADEIDNYFSDSPSDESSNSIAGLK